LIPVKSDRTSFQTDRKLDRKSVQITYNGGNRGMKQA